MTTVTLRTTARKNGFIFYLCISQFPWNCSERRAKRWSAGDGDSGAYSYSNYATPVINSRRKYEKLAVVVHVLHGHVYVNREL